MSARPAFDTLQYTSRLKAAGVPDTQAETHAGALAEALEASMKTLATQDDLRDAAANLGGRMDMLDGRMDKLDARMDLLSTELRAEMKHLGTELRGEMKQLAAELRGELGAMRWILATLTAAITALLVKSFA